MLRCNDLRRVITFFFPASCVFVLLNCRWCTEKRKTHSVSILFFFFSCLAASRGVSLVESAALFFPTLPFSLSSQQHQHQQRKWRIRSLWRVLGCYCHVCCPPLFPCSHSLVSTFFSLFFLQGNDRLVHGWYVGARAHQHTETIYSLSASNNQQPTTKKSASFLSPSALSPLFPLTELTFKICFSFVI
jgi:hypothetical protein